MRVSLDLKQLESTSLCGSSSVGGFESFEFNSKVLTSNQKFLIQFKIFGFKSGVSRKAHAGVCSRYAHVQAIQYL